MCHCSSSTNPVLPRAQQQPHTNSTAQEEVMEERSCSCTDREAAIPWNWLLGFGALQLLPGQMRSLTLLPNSIFMNSVLINAVREGPHHFCMVQKSSRFVPGRRDGHSSGSGNTGRLQLFPGKQQGHGHAVIPLLFYDGAVPSYSVCTEEPGIHLPAGGMPGRDGIYGPVAQIMQE